MKLLGKSIISVLDAVLPLTREWIEITPYSVRRHKLDVLPLTREWIEMGTGTA